MQMFKIQLCALLQNSLNKNSFVVFCSLFSKYVILLKLLYVLPTSEHQALIDPWGA